MTNRMKELRRGLGIGQKQLAEDLGVAQNTISQWERGVRSIDGERIAQLSNYFEVSADYLLGLSDLKGEKSGLYGIPIIGTVKAGYGAFAYEDDLGVEPSARPMGDDYFYLIVRGSSMEPLILDGDMALVHKQPDVESGDLAVVLVDGQEGTIKRLLKKGGSVILQPFNPEYPTEVFSGAELEDLHIVGRVVETKRKW